MTYKLPIEKGGYGSGRHKEIFDYNKIQEDLEDRAEHFPTLKRTESPASRVGEWTQKNQIKPYKGYTFDFDEDVEEDNVKTFHYAIKDGVKHMIDVSPYMNLDQETFEAWIDAGKPTREDVKSTGPLKKEEIIKLKELEDENWKPAMDSPPYKPGAIKL